MRKLTTILLVLCLLPMLGCSPLENQARDTAAALSGSIVAAQTKYQASCTANPALEICRIINRGVSGENALITAVETYCGWTPTLGSSGPDCYLCSGEISAGCSSSSHCQRRYSDIANKRSAIKWAQQL